MRHQLIAVLALGLVGCMPFRFYPLPVSAAEARDTFAPIATAASNLGYRAYRHPDRVVVEPDALTRIDYTFDAGGNYSMCVMIKDKHVAGGLDAAFAAGKAKGDQLWTQAMALRGPIAPAPVPPTASVQLQIGR